LFFCGHAVVIEKIAISFLATLLERPVHSLLSSDRDFQTTRSIYHLPLSHCLNSTRRRKRKRPCRTHL